MIVGLGIDIAEMARLAKVYDKFGRRFLEKILTPAELATLPVQALPYIAGRFAAKEAAVKALGTGFSQGIGPGRLKRVALRSGNPCSAFWIRPLSGPKAWASGTVVSLSVMSAAWRWPSSFWRHNAQSSRISERSAPLAASRGNAGLGHGGHTAGPTGSHADGKCGPGGL